MKAITLCSGTSISRRRRSTGAYRTVTLRFYAWRAIVRRWWRFMRMQERREPVAPVRLPAVHLYGDLLQAVDLPASSCAGADRPGVRDDRQCNCPPSSAMWRKEERRRCAYARGGLSPAADENQPPRFARYVAYSLFFPFFFPFSLPSLLSPPSSSAFSFFLFPSSFSFTNLYPAVCTVRMCCGAVVFPSSFFLSARM